jgi:hypothetical protein
MASIAPAFGQQAKATAAKKATALLRAQLEKIEYLSFTNVPMIRKYLRRGADANTTSTKGITPLHVAAAHNKVTMADPPPYQPPPPE